MQGSGIVARRPVTWLLWLASTLLACHGRGNSLGSMSVGSSDPRFDQSWRALSARGEGDSEVFYIEDDRGDGLMASVRRARSTTAAASPRSRLIASDAAAGAAATAVEDDLPAGEDVAAVVRANLAAVKFCYLRLSRETGRTVSGRAIVNFTVAKDGGVEAVSVDAPAFQDTDLPRCVSQQVQRWNFPKSKRGGLAVSYPFVFVGG